MQLYEILLGKVSQLSDKFTPFEGYTAVMGMLKWALRIDLRRALEVLVN